MGKRGRLDPDFFKTARTERRTLMRSGLMRKSRQRQTYLQRLSGTEVPQKNFREKVRISDRWMKVVTEMLQRFPVPYGLPSLSQFPLHC